MDLINLATGATIAATIITLLFLSQAFFGQWIARPGHSSTTATSVPPKPHHEPRQSKVELCPMTPELAAIYQQLEGTWSLVSYEVRIRGPVIITRYPFGKNAAGFIMYSPDGYMSAQLMAPGAHQFAATNYHDGSVNEMTNAARNYLAYSGPYSVERGTNSKILLRHSVEVSLYPNWLGTDQNRVCEITDTEMTLIPDTLPTWKVSKMSALDLVRPC